MLGLFNDLFGKKKVVDGVKTEKEVEAILDSSVLLVVKDVFMIKGRGVFVAGTINAGQVNVGDMVIISSHAEIPVRVDGLEKSGKQSTSAQAGENVAIIFSSLTTDQVLRGDHIKLA